MSRAMFCDRCGKIYSSQDNKAGRVQFARAEAEDRHATSVTSYGVIKDLCPGCADAVERAINENKTVVMPPQGVKLEEL